VTHFLFAWRKICFCKWPPGPLVWNHHRGTPRQSLARPWLPSCSQRLSSSGLVRASGGYPRTAGRREPCTHYFQHSFRFPSGWNCQAVPARIKQRARRGNLWLRFLQKDDVGIGMATQDAKTLAVRRPVKRKDLLPVEFGDLPAGRTVNLLNPDVVHAILANAVCAFPSVVNCAAVEIRGSTSSRRGECSVARSSNAIFSMPLCFSEVRTSVRYAKVLPSGEMANSRPTKMA